MNMSISLDSQALPAAWLNLLKEQLGSVRYGVIQIVVHDGRVVQIERTEKFRFEKFDRRDQPN